MSTEKERLEQRFKEMGIPTPMTIVEGVQPVKNLDMYQKIQALKMGVKRGEMSSFVSKQEHGGFEPIPIPQKKTRGREPQQVTPEPERSAPINSEADMIEKMFFGGGGHSGVVSGRDYDMGARTEFSADDIQARLMQKLSEKGNNVVPTYNVKSYDVPKQGEINPYLTLSEADFKKKIISISKQVSETISKRIIKEALVEYAKAGNIIINETDKIKKAEVVDEETVKIDGKLYKLTPVKK